MKIKRSELSECELTVMKCIWDEEKPVTCPQIMEQLREKYGLDYKDTTVYTFLKVLKEKGFVKSERRGVTYYTAIKQEEKYREEVLKKTEKFWFGGSSLQMISALLRVKDISDEERKEIKRIIDELD
ncbi:MAG: BlaI/MecI/CopY family transcriptional regulator [Lachnospiraceae bacterium]|nr:BlaI/MecI/CopY family transcriptional regulator [Lachnospiraceae bacterium]